MSEKKISERAQKILDLLCLLNPCHPGLEPGSKIPHQVRDDKHRNDGILPPGEIWIRQATLAEHFGCSRTTIGRVIKELKEAGFMTELSEKYLNRYKTYSLSRHPSLSSHPSLELGSRIPGQARDDKHRDDKHRDDETTSPAAPRHDDNVLPMSLADVRLDEPAQVVRDKNEIEALLAKHGAEWQRRHPYFGTGDKPTLHQWVFNMGFYGKPFRLREGKNLEEWIESMFITTEKWAVEWAMAIVERQKREQEQQSPLQGSQ